MLRFRTVSSSTAVAVLEDAADADAEETRTDWHDYLLVGAEDFKTSNTKYSF